MARMYLASDDDGLTGEALCFLLIFFFERKNRLEKGVCMKRLAR